MDTMTKDTKLVDIDYQLGEMYGGNATLGALIAEYTKSRCIDRIDAEADTAARDAVYSTLFEVTGIETKYAVSH